MIEILHFKNRFGKAVVAVFIDVNVYHAPAAREYAQRYAAGLEKPYYPVPVCIEHSPETMRLVTIIYHIFHELFRY